MSSNASGGAASGSPSSQVQATTSTNAPSSSSLGTTIIVVTSTSTTPNPVTPATTATPSQSSPAQTSVTTDALVSSSSTSPTTFTSAAAPTTTFSTSSFTTQVATTLSSTDSAGSIVYITTAVPDVISTTVPASTSSSSSHTGVIVGAVVGGVAGIAILALLLFCIRRRARKDEFDGNFDPDRIVGHADNGGGTLPQVNLADEVTPFPQTYEDQGGSSMRQYPESPYATVPSSTPGSGKASTDFYPPGGGAATDAQPRPFMRPGPGPPPPGARIPPINMYGAGPVDWHTPRPGVSPPPSTASNYTSSTRATKEREALERSGQGSGLGLATQQEVAEGSGDVVVHQDAGRAPVEEQVPPREIPPAYESIRQD